MANTNQEISVTQGVINDLEADIEVQEKNLEQATIKMDNQYESFKTQVRVSYEMGETTYLDIILGSDDFFDMLSRMQISKQLMNHNKTVFEEYTNNAKIVEDAKLQLEENKKTQEVHRLNLDNKILTLEKQSAQSESKMKDLMQDENKAEAAEAQNLKAEDEMADRVAQLSKELAGTGAYVGGELSWPVPSSTRVTSPFGNRKHPITNKQSFHKGVDIGASGGSSIISANAGKVIVSDYQSAYGNYVMVDHGGGTVTLYAHMQKRLVSAGDTVGKGEKIGLVGTTGWSTGNHLHFEVIKNGDHTNPMNYFS